MRHYCSFCRRFKSSGG